MFKETGADKKADGMLLFRGTDGTSKPWKQYFDAFERAAFTLQRPHHVTANVAALSTLIPWDFEAANHTWLFAEELPEDGDDAEIINVNWADPDGDLVLYNSVLEWDEDDECYYRYMYNRKGKSYPYMNLTTSDYDSEEITFNNIIVQFTEMVWERTDAPKPTVLGTGNADFFMGGKHIAGVWNRESLSDRTVFYGADGEEIELQPGRTLIIVMDYETANRSVSYE